MPFNHLKKKARYISDVLKERKGGGKKGGTRHREELVSIALAFLREGRRRKRGGKEGIATFLSPRAEKDGIFNNHHLTTRGGGEKKRRGRQHPLALTGGRGPRPLCARAEGEKESSGTGRGA